jgi:tetratricopeptide (TPR) repeat protein
MRPLLAGLLFAGLTLAGSGRPLAAQDSLASRARQLAASGEFRQAASTWRMVLDARPDDQSALAGLVDALEATGEWRNAIAPLDRLLALGGADPARLRQRGIYAAWSGDRERGLALLRKAVTLRPRDPVSLGALAQVLSWSPATQTEASQRFAEALRYDSTSADLLVGYADLLSWTPRTRNRAEALYRRTLAHRPGEPRARIGLANLLAWQGEPARALQIYDSVLADSPDQVEALRGRGGAANQLGQYDWAVASLQRALALAPQDTAIAGELARAELASGRFRSARGRLSGRVDPLYVGVADSALRATASAAEISGMVRGRENQLDLSRVLARTTGALGSLKLFAEYERSELRDGVADFRSEGYGGGARIDHRGLALAAGGRVREVHGLGSTQWDGYVDLGWRISKRLSVGAGAVRAPVEESRRSVQGVIDGGQLRGVANANLAHLTLGLLDLPGPFDAEATLLAGRYTGLGLEPNQRVSLDTRVGLVLHSSAPWIRIGYGFSATGFDYNADPGFTQAPAQRGGYFSPAKYWRHHGILQITQPLGSRVHWEADARLGREWLRQLDGAATSSRNSAVAHTALTIRLGSRLDLGTRLLYVNAFDAFEMKELATVLKVYFR